MTVVKGWQDDNCKKTYRVSDFQVERCRAQVDAANRKIEKLNKKGFFFEPARLELSDAIFEKVPIQLPSGETVHRTRVSFDVSLQSELIKIEGWQFIATLQHEDGGTIIRPVPGVTEEGELNLYRTTGDRCEHCQKNVRRNSTFVLRNLETKEKKQVGSTCLHDFLGIDPQAIPLYASLMSGLNSVIELLGSEGSSDGAMQCRFSLEQFLAFTCREIRENGWVSRKTAYEQYKASTSDHAWNAMMDFSKACSCRDSEKVAALRPSERDEDLSKRIMGFLETHFDTMPESELTDYLHNVKVTYTGGTVESSLAGLAASIVPYVTGAWAREEERLNGASSTFVGEIGIRATFELTCVTLPQGNRPGLFRDSAGNRVQAWNVPESVIVGKTYKIKATPTKHSTFRDIKSTIVNRLVVLSVN